MIVITWTDLTKYAVFRVAHILNLKISPLMHNKIFVLFQYLSSDVEALESLKQGPPKTRASTHTCLVLRYILKAADILSQKHLTAKVKK